VVGVDLAWSLVRDDVEIVARCDVVPGCVPAVRDDLGVKAGLEIGLVDEEGVSATYLRVRRQASSTWSHRNLVGVHVLNQHIVTVVLGCWLTTAAIVEPASGKQLKVDVAASACPTAMEVTEKVRMSEVSRKMCNSQR